MKQFILTSILFITPIAHGAEQRSSWFQRTRSKFEDKLLNQVSNVVLDHITQALESEQTAQTLSGQLVHLIQNVQTNKQLFNYIKSQVINELTRAAASGNQFTSNIKKIEHHDRLMRLLSTIPLSQESLNLISNHVTSLLENIAQSDAVSKVLHNLQSHQELRTAMDNLIIGLVRQLVADPEVQSHIKTLVTSLIQQAQK